MDLALEGLPGTSRGGHSPPRRGSNQQGTLRNPISKRQRSRKIQKSIARTLRPGIRVDTSVSRHRGVVPKSAFSNETELLSLSHPGQPTRTRSPRSAGRHASQEGLMIHISPSDRVIPIGIAVPESHADAHLRSATSSLKAGTVDPSPMTPTILITPACEESDWWSDSTEDYHGKMRVTSSLYSRPTTHLAAAEFNEAPPLPEIPANLSKTLNKSNSKHDNFADSEDKPLQNRDSAMTAFEEDEETKQRGRAESNATVFEEDEGRRPSIRRASRRAPDLMIETSIPTPLRSFGWWNFITTPFETARSPFKSRSPMRTSEDAPPVPILPYAAPIASSYVLQKRHSNPFEDPPHSEYSRSFASLDMAKVQPVLRHPSYADMSAHLNFATAAVTKEIHQSHDHRFEPIATGKARFASAKTDVTSREVSNRFSNISLTSPHEREVPIMLDSDAEPSTPSPKPFQQTPLPNNGPERRVNTYLPSTTQWMEPSAATHFSSPTSDRTLSPAIMSIAAVAPMVSARAIETEHIKPTLQHELYFPPPPKHAEFSRPHSKSASSELDRKGPRRPIIIGLPHPSQCRKQPVDHHFVAEIPVNAHHESKRHEIDGIQSKNTTRNAVHNRKFTLPPIKNWLAILKKGKNSKEKKKKKSRRRCCCLCCLAFLFCVIIAVIIGMAVSLSRKQHRPISNNSSSPGQTQVLWLNITNFPPIPAGVVTIVQPDLRFSQSGCVVPSTLWSCAVPKEQQSSIAPNNPDQPNFWFEIKQNASLTTVSDPSPPNLDEQRFLGNTTDQNSLPFEGEQTPFLISFLSNTSPPSRIRRRASLPTTTSQSFPDLIGLIPTPAVNADGRAAPANLLPFPTAQPMHMYNRGLNTEHYGFYTYFDRAIFLKNKALVDSSNSDFSNIPADEDGGSSFDSASVRCTWAQTRFLVQIWTNMGSKAHLLPANRASSANTLNAFSRPGGFPYPVSITLDRHGGDTPKKMLYCYSMDDSGRILVDQKKLALEDKTFSGTTVNPTDGPFENVTVSTKLGGPGGIDGGTGGCGCRWENFLRV